MRQYLVGDLVAEFIAQCGVKTAFGIVSIHNIPILDGVARQGRVRFVGARGEMGAGHMADGYARAAGGLGVAITSTGPAASNAATAVLEAKFAGTPVLHITGQSPVSAIGRGQGALHDATHQLDMLKSVSKAAFRIDSAQETLGVLTRAAMEAMAPHRGPVSVEIPFDIQRQPVARPTVFDAGFELPSRAGPVPVGKVLDELAERVSKARRPMLWLGNGARDAGAAVKRLLDLGFGCVNSLAAPGIVPGDHPRNLGCQNGGRDDPAVEAFYGTCDLMIVVGSRLRLVETREGALRLPRPLIQIDADPAANGRTYVSDAFLCADSAAALDGLADRLQGRMTIDPAFATDLATVKRQALDTLVGGLSSYATFAGQLREVMPRDAVWVRDITLNGGSWGAKAFPVYGPRDSIYPISVGIGQGLPLGIGAAVAANADGRKAVMMAGDGGFAMHLGEMWTALQEKVDMTVLIMNDGGYGVIKHIQDADYGGRHIFGDLLQPDYGKLADLLGVPFGRVTKPEEFGPVMARAIAVKGLSLVEVDMNAIGPFPSYQVRPATPVSQR